MSIRPTSVMATNSRGGAVELAGRFRCAVKYNEKLISTLRYVVNYDIKLPGVDWLGKFGLSNLPIETFYKRVQTSQKHKFSSAHHPQSNGQVDRLAYTIKRLVLDSRREGNMEKPREDSCWSTTQHQNQAESEESSQLKH